MRKYDPKPEYTWCHPEALRLGLYPIQTADPGADGFQYSIRFFSKKLTGLVGASAKQRRELMKYLLWDRTMTQYRGSSTALEFEKSKSLLIPRRWIQQIEEPDNGGLLWAKHEMLPLAFSYIHTNPSKQLEEYLVRTMGRPSANVEWFRIDGKEQNLHANATPNATRNFIPAISFIYDPYKGWKREEIDLNDIW